MEDFPSIYDVGKFGAWDYVVLALMLSISSGIGIYYALTGGRQSTTREFLLADRNMNPFPVAMSLVASFISAVTVLGTPAEVYLNGSMFMIFCFGYIGMGLVTSMFLPTLYRLGITSANEYLEMRFNRTARILGTILFFIQTILYLGLVIYAPALALNQVTGLSLWGSVMAIGIVCTFYTTIGGMKAVLWTDTFQVVVMMIGFLAVIIAGSMNIGGFDKVWEICVAGDRIDFWNFDPDPTIRHTFWTITIGGSFFWGSVYGVNQSQVQRYLTCGSVKTAILSLCLAVVGMCIVVISACLCGLVMYANFAECDPLSMGYVGKSDQLIPYFVLYLFGTMPGLPGLFTSAVFSAALSTVSSGLNSLAAVAGEDIVKSIWPKMAEKKYTMVSKCLALFFGLVSILMVYVSSQLGPVLGAAFSVFGMIGGPLLGLYSLGMFFPWTNSYGAVIGSICGLIWSLWIGIGAQIYPPVYARPSLSTYGCSGNVTIDALVTAEMISTVAMETDAAIQEEARPAIAELYGLSYLWYTAAAASITIIFGLVISFVTGATDPRTLDPKLICPVVDRMYCCLPEVIKAPLRCHVGEHFGDLHDRTDGVEMKVQPEDTAI